MGGEVMSFNALISALQGAQETAFSTVSADESIANERNEIGQILVDLGCCADVLSSRFECPLYDMALNEIQLSLLAALGASYRQAFMGLRLALEHWFTGILFSTNEFTFRKWQLHEWDVSWNELNNDDNGILSKEFAHVFWPSTEQRIHQYRNIAKSLYRECSEYVHGNPKTHLSLPKQLIYDQTTFLLWKNKLETIKLLFIYTFVLRYGPTLPSEKREKISGTILKSVGHLQETRDLFGGS